MDSEGLADIGHHGAGAVSPHLCLRDKADIEDYAVGLIEADTLEVNTAQAASGEICSCGDPECAPVPFGGFDLWSDELARRIRLEASLRSYDLIDFDVAVDGGSENLLIFRFYAFCDHPVCHSGYPPSAMPHQADSASAAQHQRLRSAARTGAAVLAAVSAAAAAAIGYAHHELGGAGAAEPLLAAVGACGAGIAMAAALWAESRR